MKKISLSLIMGVGLVAIASFSAQAEQRITYECTQNKTFEAQFSPNTAQVQLSSDETLTLTQVPTASGVRYSDGKITLYTKGKEAFIEKNDHKLYEQCLAQETTKPMIRGLW
ncbi:hypothetical protein PCC9214_00504 [Planktothrix tepida]|uniref:C-type lysozyme inhibitor domain-containing protein n=1 Tax=Planktothrix tepida PCC 9214 TaxID=671072 RepID=A0A1J1LGT3_9CYAN|nr:MliC family protein [Planktothrix tepida]CAD5918518.1 hypothetical protein PCC9214_00504 [Planktothrix tepida]CUR30793.1 conserved exported hypothetical protein [Planktothrix tepida PCC 9214]